MATRTIPRNASCPLQPLQPSDILSKCTYYIYIYIDHNNQYKLEKQALMTGFGKMVPSKNQTNPKYSFGKEKLNYQKMLKPTTEYIYHPFPENKYKYIKSPGWSFGKSPRRDLNERERYAHYNNSYNHSTDKENIRYRWNKPVGGLIGTENRMKRVIDETTPGPGRYNPEIRYARYHNGTAGYMGMKINDNLLLRKTGTNDEVAPTSYEIGNKSHYHKFVNSPMFSFGNDKRKGLNRKGNTKQETYAMYSAFGEQIMTMKDSRPGFSFGKEERFGRKDVGI